MCEHNVVKVKVGPPIAAVPHLHHSVTLAPGPYGVGNKQISPRRDPISSGFTSGFSVTELGNADEAREKLRVREFVKVFAKDALSGVACKLFDMNAQECASAVYKLDEKLSLLTFEGDEDVVRGEVLAVLPLAQMEQIASFAEIGVPERKILEQRLSSDERGSMILLRAPEVVASPKYVAISRGPGEDASREQRILSGEDEGLLGGATYGGEPASEAYILMNSLAQKEHFATCIKILRVYSQTTV